MILWRTVRSWAAVHSTRPAVVVLGIVGVASLVFGQVWVSEFGLIVLVTPVSLLLLLPAVAGVAVAIAADNTARLPLPDPPRAAVGRATWAAGWTVMAAAIANVGQMAGAEIDWRPVARNVVLFAALGLATVRLGLPHLAWLPTLMFTLACMLFGYPPSESRYYWWAVIMEDTVAAPQATIVVAAFITALLGYTVGDPARRLLARSALHGSHRSNRDRPYT